jgi:hypothetical protein
LVVIWLVVILTLIPASAILPAMKSLRQTGSGMISVRVGADRGQPKSDSLSMG